MLDGVDIRTVSGPVINEINIICPKQLYSLSSCIIGGIIMLTNRDVGVVMERTDEWHDERECHRGTVEHLNCHQSRLLVNDNNGQ